MMQPLFKVSQLRSDFLFYRIETEDRETFKEELKKIAEENPDAAHILHACRIKDKNGLYESCTENGEPVKAAHKTLFILSKRGIENLGLVAVRYFGGKKLGAQNLERVFLEGFEKALASKKE